MIHNTASMVLLCISVLFFIVSFFLSMKSRMISLPSAQTEAFISRVEERVIIGKREFSRFVFVWVFKDTSGKIHEVPSLFYASEDAFTVGDKSIIWYWPEHPEQGFVVDVERSNLVPIAWLCSIVGVVFYGLSIMFGFLL